MNKRLFKKVLHEKGAEIAYFSTKGAIAYYIIILFLGCILAGVVNINIVELIEHTITIALIGFVTIFLMEVYNENKK